nr:TPA_asm: FtsK [Ladona dragonfly adintovirus]
MEVKYKLVNIIAKHSVLQMPLKWVHPFTCICAGPSGCGKTTFVVKFLGNLKQLVRGDIKRIIWVCNKGSQPAEHIPGVSFIHELPSFENPSKINTLYVIDDLMHECYNREVSQLFTRGSHHNNISVILITQNIFYQSRESRNISLNAKYIVAFKNPRDTRQFLYLARQIYPTKPCELYNAYLDATDKPHGYLVLDLSQEKDRRLRFYTNIFPGEIPQIYSPEGEVGKCSEVLL